jgi:hypothetical protein
MTRGESLMRVAILAFTGVVVLGAVSASSEASLADYRPHERARFEGGQVQPLDEYLSEALRVRGSSSRANGAEGLEAGFTARLVDRAETVLDLSESVVTACEPEIAVRLENYRPGEEIRADRLADFLREHLCVVIEGDSERLRLLWFAEVRSRGDEVDGRRAGAFPDVCKAKVCIVSGEELFDDEPLFRAELFQSDYTFVLGRVVEGASRGMPRECEDATHALVLEIRAEDTRLDPIPAVSVCMRLDR